MCFSHILALRLNTRREARLVWLVAEDEPDIRILVMTMFQMWGHEPLSFENGQRVWEWLDRVEAPGYSGALPELVLMDIRMPGRKGSEVAARMRRMPAFAHTPIALMTAFALSDGERRQMAEEDGVDEIIAKPLPEFDLLRQMLHDLLRKKHVPPAPEPSPVESAP